MHPDKNAQEPRSQVQHRLATIEDELKRLHDHIDRFEIKLRPILLVSSEGEGKPGTGGGMPELVPLAEELYALGERIETATNRILSLMERSEI